MFYILNTCRVPSSIYGQPRPAIGLKTGKPETWISALLWLAGVRHGDYTAMWFRFQCQ